jgi:mono/diheme cytochrome c family protein
MDISPHHEGNFMTKSFRAFSLVPLLAFALMITACSGTDGNSAQNAQTTVALEGDAAHGAELFTQSVGGAPACSTCHTTNGTVVVGPSFQGYGAIAGTRAFGESAEEYTHNSIIRPASYIVSGFSNSMYNQYERALSDQDIADLTAYLLSL